MRPKVILMQAGFVVVVLLGLVLFGHPVTALLFAGPLLGVAVGLLTGFLYARRAYAQRRAACEEVVYELRSRQGEAMVVAGWLLACAVPAGPALAALSFDLPLVRSPDPRAVGLGLGGLSVAVTIMLGSSLMDWYVKLPHLSGLVCDPPCMDARNDRWSGLTQVCLVHRWLAAVAVIGGLMLALAVLLGALAYHAALGVLTGTAESRDAAAIAALFGVATPIVAWTSGLIRTLAGTYVDALRTGTARSLRRSFAVGDYLAIRRASGERSEGYLLDVALEAIDVVPTSAIVEAPRERVSAEIIWAAELETATVKPSRGPYCTRQRCRYMNETYCLRAKQLREWQGERVSA
jgi:hypothetical protein